MVAFEAVFALLIYGLVLFPNVPGFVNINVIIPFPHCLVTHISRFIIGIVKEMELSCVLYLYYSNGLSHTCLSLLSSAKTKAVGIGLKDSCLLQTTISIGIPWQTMRWKSLKAVESLPTYLSLVRKEESTTTHSWRNVNSDTQTLVNLLVSQ